MDVDPDALFDLAQNEVERERKLAVDLGRKLFGDRVTDWKSLGEIIRADPQERFASADEIRDFTQRVYERAYAAAGRIVTTPPVAKVVLEPFPEFQQATAPGGQYIPAAEDGSRPATYLYRNVTADTYRTSLENVILHETIPGHHLQIAFLAEHGRKDNHPISRLLFFSGPGEGWATYAEDFAYEIGLYDSDRDYIGREMSSITPWMVLELGTQVKGWTMEQALAYAYEARPLRSPADGEGHGRADQQPARIRARVPARRHEMGRDAQARRGSARAEVRREGLPPGSARGRHAPVLRVERETRPLDREPEMTGVRAY